MTCKEKLKIDHPDIYDMMFANSVGPGTPIGWQARKCPSSFGYLADPPIDGEGDCVIGCTMCWDRKVDDKPSPEKVGHIKDSGNRRTFETGAVRDICEGKGRCDLMPLDVVRGYINHCNITDDKIFFCISEFQKTGCCGVLYNVIDSFRESNSVKSEWPDVYTMLLEIAKHFEEGAKKYGDNNWQKGIPVRCYIDSAIRHYLKFLRGDIDEPHDRAFVWNIMCCIWTCKHMPELNDYAKEKGTAKDESAEA